MKFIYASLGLAVFLLIVNGAASTMKDTLKHYYQARCTDPKEEDIKLLVEHLEKCDNQVAKLKNIADEVDNDKDNRVKLFRKFCKLYPELYNCVEDPFNMIKRCMSVNELKLITIVGELQKFMCLEDGKRGAVFIAEDGFDCLNKITQNVRTCVSKSVGHPIPDLDLSFCKEVGRLKKCIKINLETCSSESHVDAFEAFSKIAKDKLECLDVKLFLETF